MMSGRDARPAHASADAEKRDIENESSVGRNRARHTLAAVGKIRWDDESSLSGDSHPDDALIPAPDYLTGTKGEREAGVRVELPALRIRLRRVVQPAAIAHDHAAPGRDDRAGADDEIELRKGHNGGRTVDGRRRR